MEVIVTLSDIIGIVVCIIFLIGVVVYAFIIKILEKIRKNKKNNRKIKDIFSLHCPECGGIMKSEYLDMEIDHIVYKCEKCGKEWV